MKYLNISTMSLRLHELIRSDSNMRALLLLKFVDCDVGEIDPETGETSLILACKKKMTSVAIKLIKTGKAKQNQIDKFDNTALSIACRNGLDEVAICLIEAGDCLPGHIDRAKMTPLLWACYFRMEKVALALIDTGQSDVEYCGAYGTARNMAKQYNLDHVNHVLTFTVPTTQPKYYS